MQTPHTANFFRYHISVLYKHPQHGELCSQTPTDTHFDRDFEKIGLQQRPENDPLQHAHPESLLKSLQTS
jgi:hypothetical protein